MALVFDACALIAYLRKEEGAQAVKAFLGAEGNVCLVHAVNLCEVYYDFLRADGEGVAEAALEDLVSVGFQVRDDLDIPFLKRIGAIKARHRIALADCFAASLANREHTKVVTTDHREFDPLVKAGICDAVFIR